MDDSKDIIFEIGEVKEILNGIYESQIKLIVQTSTLNLIMLSVIEALKDKQMVTDKEFEGYIKKVSNIMTLSVSNPGSIS